jgi:hypothetical protein
MGFGGQQTDWVQEILHQPTIFGLLTTTSVKAPVRLSRGKYALKMEGNLKKSAAFIGL